MCDQQDEEDRSDVGRAERVSHVTSVKTKEQGVVSGLAGHSIPSVWHSAWVIEDA